MAYTTEHGFARFEDRETAFGMYAVGILVDIVDTFGCIAPDIERAETTEIDVMPLSHVGLDSLAQEAMSNIDPNGELKTDTAQLLNYFYNMGSGGLMHSESHEDIINSEMQWLLRCYQVADRTDNPYWKANSLQAISEHMENEADADLIIKNYATLQQMVSEGKELSARVFAEQALDLFEEYGDVYHTKPDCNAIHHDIIRVSILDVGGKGPCSKCGV